MIQSSQQAGKPIRELQHRRLRKSILFTFFSGVFLSAAVYCFWIYFINQQTDLLTIPNFAYKAGLIFSILAIYSSFGLLKRSEYAAQGASAEEDIGRILESFCSRYDWNRKSNAFLENWRGDIDIVLCSPNDTWICIDVKSSSPKFLSQKILTSSAGQAVNLKKEVGIHGWVQSVICFMDDAHFVNTAWTKKHHSYVTSREHLTDLSLHLDKINS